MGFPLRLFFMEIFCGHSRKGMIMEERLTDIGERLRSIRKERGYKQEVFAEMIGCSSVTVSRWENGQCTMKIGELAKVAECLGISADYLLGIEKRENAIGDMMNGLCDSDKEIVIHTVRAMVESMKIYHKC